MHNKMFLKILFKYPIKYAKILGFFLKIHVIEADKYTHVYMKSQAFINLQALFINCTYSYILTKKENHYIERSTDLIRALRISVVPLRDSRLSAVLLPVGALPFFPAAELAFSFKTSLNFL